MRYGFSEIYPEDRIRCPYCGSNDIVEVDPERIVYVEIGVKLPRMIIQKITVDEEADRVIGQVPRELIAWAKKEKPRLEYKTASRAYFFAYKNALTGRDPRLWHLVEDVKRLGSETLESRKRQSTRQPQSQNQSQKRR